MVAMKLDKKTAAEVIDKEQPQVIILINDTEEEFKVTIFGRVPKPEAAELIEAFCHNWKEQCEESDDLPF